MGGKRKNCQNPSQAIIRLKKEEKKKWYGSLSHWCREGETLVVRPLKKTLFLCVPSLIDMSVFGHLLLYNVYV